MMGKKSCLNCIHEHVCKDWEVISEKVQELYGLMIWPKISADITEENKFIAFQLNVVEERAIRCDNYKPLDWQGEMTDDPNRKE